MKTETKATWYDFKSSLCTTVSMLGSIICPDCERGIKSYDTMESCKRCHGDGFLTNQLKFNENLLEAASNVFPLGTVVRINCMNEGKACNYCDYYFKGTKYCILESKKELKCRYNESIHVRITDKGPNKNMCECGHTSTCHGSGYGDGGCQHCNCHKFQSHESWIDLTKFAFSLLAPVSLGIIKVEVEQD